MSSRRYWLVYTVVRILLFAVPFGLVVAVSPDFWPLAAVIGAVVSFCGSYIFLRKQREAMAADLAAIAAGRKAPVEDDDSEDAAVDAAERRARAAGAPEMAGETAPGAGSASTAAATPRTDGEAERS
ncbi:DUF4229 domain-containing protein [Clavibacter michiganensis subsp. michiganensis]|uniref:DUF4229 domain-containing protein n=1 Tax=Clavibacter michiganensis TaxID=28447 RepID=UPI00136614A3|nr:DUF4229 domain-containing protein [Clavibacter michiganensis subsp. michiganensis]